MKEIVFSKKIFSISAHWRYLKLNLAKTRWVLFFFTNGEESYNTCIFFLKWYGDRCFIRLSIPVIFHNQRRELTVHFSISYFSFLKIVGCLQVGCNFIPSMATICWSLSSRSNKSLPDRALESEQWHTESTCSLLFAAFFEVSLLLSGCILYAYQFQSIS